MKGNQQTETNTRSNERKCLETKKKTTKNILSKAKHQREEASKTKYKA